jgi:hypothetical protein
MDSAETMRLADASREELARLDDDVREVLAVAIAAAPLVDVQTSVEALVKLWWTAERRVTAEIVAERAASLGVNVLPHVARILDAYAGSSVHDQRKLAAAVLAERHGDVLLAHTAKYAVDRAVRSEEARQQREACAYLPWVSDHEVLLEAMCALGDDEFCQAAAERYITVAGLDAARAVVERQVVTPATFE